MPKLKINNKEIEVPEGFTVIQACEKAGIEIPRFCYHDKLKIAGNCRMCLVEMERAPKPVASCAQVAMEGMVIHTNTPLVKKAREGVMEFLLANHPLDCPICDQGGECDLQDQAMKYGKPESRYKEEKRAVKDKDFGPLIQTHMTRCIHCTRCVRFIEDIAGTYELGGIGRGEDVEITNYIEGGVKSELSGNIIDLCPVGALTSKPYEFKARNWELHRTESIDVMDAVGSNIIINTRGNEVMRILPYTNEDINEEWISDKTRFFYDGLKYQRLDRPYIKQKNKLEETSWEIALNILAKRIKKTKAEKIGAIAGDLTDVETMFVVKDYLKALGSYNVDCRQNGSKLSNKNRAQYTFNTTIKGIEEADHCLLIGCNPRHEATMVNARIRKAYLNNKLSIAVIGNNNNLTYPYKHLGDNPWILKQIADGVHPICTDLKKAKKPMLIFGEHLTTQEDYEAYEYFINKLVNKYNYTSNDWNGYNILHTAASRVGGLDIDFVPNKDGMTTNEILKKCEVIILFGADEINLNKINKNAFVIYIGHHGDKAAEVADIILPAPAFTEKNATYVNLEGRVQNTFAAIDKLGKAKIDWQIILDLANLTGVKLQYSTLNEIRKKISKVNPVFINTELKNNDNIFKNSLKQTSFFQDKIDEKALDYYLTNSICRNSITMKKCSQIIF
ncbi:NADH-quinone oxidoreductase subunit NuoG [Rickettsiales endosymbiont of Trichoplax sp. H2]|uniref:NADH-quinone oxidoreductase subunit NuoG n=1 Tax=Rickettsiales endosymbiont of Trichoplax sp. H2 TaxID=2021221 RepID=UPI0012B1B3A8|nr:NADH-quinone oxidoreductase subunit NuoG [Rickettsiales endosymbiont of Trichoplax sp. H2]MSO14556.1 NADH-quinone oxidoreductase subunit G [Rickettsiales endosymbiont of Trichoplax sp. H2]